MHGLVYACVIGQSSFWRANPEMSASGFYGSLHPAYQPFNILAEGPTHGNAMAGFPAGPIAANSDNSEKLATASSNKSRLLRLK